MIRLAPYMLAAGAAFAVLGYAAMLRHENASLRAAVERERATAAACKARAAANARKRERDSEIDKLGLDELRRRAAEWLRQ